MGARKTPMPSGKVASRNQAAARGKARNKALAKKKKGWPSMFGDKKDRRKFPRPLGQGKTARAAGKSKPPQKSAGKRPQGKFGGGKGRHKPQRKPVKSKGKRSQGGRTEPSVSEAKMKDFLLLPQLQFDFIDINGDGNLTKAEVDVAQANITARYDKQQVLKGYEALLRQRLSKENFMDTVDKNKDGVLTFDEFKFFKNLDSHAQKRLDLQQRQEAQFTYMDADKDGELTADEALAAKKTLKEKDDLQKQGGDKMERFESLLLGRMVKDDWMKSVDTNGDGRLSFDEFKFFKKLEPRPQEL